MPALKSLSVKNLLIDIGNSSHCKLAVSDGSSILSVRRLEKAELLSAVEKEHTGGEIDVVCVSSVAQDDPALEAGLRTVCGKLVMVSAFTPMPLKVDYETPGTLGADRIAAALGAAELFPDESCLIFDFGTAITVDLVTSDRRFMGGNISPGLSLRLKALHEHTGRLPLVSPAAPVRTYGGNTAEAINNGVVLGIMFEVEKYLENNPQCRIIFTGGDSLFFAKKLKSPIFVTFNLVLKGLFKIAQLNNV